MRSAGRSAGVDAMIEPLISPLLPVPHAFSTRQGGVSQGPYASLNLSPSTGDDPQRVAQNQHRLLEHFGHPPQAALHQIHSNRVWVVDRPGVWEGDGLITAQPGLLLRVGVADCFPLLLYEPQQGVVAALHAGWRGVVGGILLQALELMQQLGCDLGQTRLAIGPGIGPCCFQVGPEVVEAFEQAGFRAAQPDTVAGKFRLDLPAVLHQQARQAGLLPQHTWIGGWCTNHDPRFFSHRRDRGITGRMWAVIILPTAPTRPGSAAGGQIESA